MTVRYKTEQPYARVMSQSSSTCFETLGRIPRQRARKGEIFLEEDKHMRKNFNRDRFYL